MSRQTRLRFHLRSQAALWYHREASCSHVLIDRQAEARARGPGFVRPIELWQSPRWHRPAGVSVVRYLDSEAGDSSDSRIGARADGDLPPGLGDVVNLSAVVDFVSDVSVFRLGALGALIDAVAAALEGGPPVVLAAPDAEQGALWIGAVSFFAPPMTCLRLSFSTHERWDDVLAQVARDGRAGKDGAARAGDADSDSDSDRSEAGDGDGRDWRSPVISVVPEADVDRLTRRDELPVVVIDPRVEATAGVAGGVEYRRTHLGQQIEITDWSRLALRVCCADYAVLERCIRRIDEPGQAELPPAWSLAAAVALTRDLPLALPLATRLILDDAQRAARLPSAQAAVLACLAASTVDDAARGWDRLRARLAEEPVPAGEAAAALETYMRLALGDDDWLLQQVPPLPAAMPLRLPDPDPDPDPGLAGAAGLPGAPGPAGLPARLRGPLAGLVQRLTDDLLDVDPAADVRRGLLLLRGVDLAHRTARFVGGPDLSQVGLARLAGRAAEVLLDDVAGPRVAEIAGPLDGEGLARWVVPRLARDPESWPRSGNPVGERLPAPVIALLSAAVDPDRLVESARADPLAGEPVALEVALAAATGRIAGDPRLRGPAAEYLLHRAARAYPDADPGPIVAEVFGRLAGDEPWPAAALLRLVERAPATLGADLVPIVLRHLPDWVDDPLSARLAAALLKRIEFLPRRGADGQLRPRRAGITDHQAQLLNLLSATGAGWLQSDDGLHRRAAEILMWGDRAWDGADVELRRLIAARITVAAFQVALAAEPAQAGTALRSRLAVVPIGSGWRAAVAIGLEPALPLIAEVLRLNRYRLAGELVLASTRAALDPGPDPGLDPARDPPPEPSGADLPRLSMLPVGPVIRWLVANEDEPELEEHLAALAEQELRSHAGALDRPELITFWERVLPESSIDPAGPDRRQPAEAMFDEVLQVALGFRDPAGHPVRAGGLAGLLGQLARRPATRPGVRAADPGTPADLLGPADPGPAPAVTETGLPAERSRSRWWRRWATR